MKKLLLTLGTVAAVAAPVASVIACGNNDSQTEAQKLVGSFVAKERDSHNDKDLSHLVALDDATAKNLEALLLNSEKVGEEVQTRLQKKDSKGDDITGPAALADLSQKLVFFNTTTPEGKTALEALLAMNGQDFAKDTTQFWEYPTRSTEIKSAEFALVIYGTKVATPPRWENDKGEELTAAIKGAAKNAFHFNGGVKDADIKGSLWLNKDADNFHSPIAFF